MGFHVRAAADWTSSCSTATASGFEGPRLSVLDGVSTNDLGDSNSRCGGNFGECIRATAPVALVKLADMASDLALAPVSACAMLSTHK